MLFIDQKIQLIQTTTWQRPVCALIHFISTFQLVRSISFLFSVWDLISGNGSGNRKWNRILSILADVKMIAKCNLESICVLKLHSQSTELLLVNLSARIITKGDLWCQLINHLTIALAKLRLSVVFHSGSKKKFLAA